MKLSVYRQGRGEPTELEHTDALRHVAGDLDLELLAWSLTHDRPVFIGLGNSPCVVKLKAEGDEGLRFEGLLDAAVTTYEFRRMQEHKADTPEAIGMRQYRVRLSVQFTETPRADFLLLAKNDADCARRTRVLVNEEAFRRQLTHSLIEYMVNTSEIVVASSGGTMVNDPAPAHAVDWEFLTDPDAD